jgi:hypothetical protein
MAGGGRGSEGPDETFTYRSMDGFGAFMPEADQVADRWHLM